MIAFGSFAILRPWWLLCLPALWLFLKFTRSLDRSLGDWPRATDPPILDALTALGRHEPYRNSDTTMIWCAVLIVLSLCGPAARGAAASQYRNLDAALILLQLSEGTNLSKITSAAQIVLRGCGARQTGLMLYAGDAYLASPLTYDLASIEAQMFAVDDQTIPDGGSRPARALELAHVILRQMNIFSGDVILIGDGSGINAQAIEEAKLLAADGHSLHTLFVAPSMASPSALPMLQSAMNELAKDGHGLAGESIMAATVADAISSRRIEHIDNGSRQALEWRDLGRFLVLSAALPLFTWFRRRGV